MCTYLFKRVYRYPKGKETKQRDIKMGISQQQHEKA